MTSSQLYKLIYDLYKKHGGFPPIWVISKESGCTAESVEKCLQHFVATKKIIYKNNLYWFPEQLDKELKIDKPTNKFSMLVLCRIVMGIIGISCIVCSIRFTYSFNKLNMPRLWGFILSSAIAIFTSFCFTIREYLKQDKKNFQANLFIVLYLMGVSYSIFTAVAGQYNDYLINNKNTVEIKRIESINDKKYELLSEEKSRYLKQVEKLNNQIESQQKIIDNLSESPERKFEYNNTWKQTLNIISDLQNQVDELEDKISNIDFELISSVVTDSNESKNIFDWIADLFKISPDIIQFIISLFPAIFIDLVSPFAIMFAFYKK